MCPGKTQRGAAHTSNHVKAWTTAWDSGTAARLWEGGDFLKAFNSDKTVKRWYL